MRFGGITQPITGILLLSGEVQIEDSNQLTRDLATPVLVGLLQDQPTGGEVRYLV